MKSEKIITYHKQVVNSFKKSKISLKSLEDFKISLEEFGRVLRKSGRAINSFKKCKTISTKSKSVYLC